MLIKRKYNCMEAKQISIISFLSRLGIQPSSQKMQDYWYCSPFRDEKTPSFKVDSAQNIWYDHGLGKGGNIIDLGIRLFNCSIPELLEKLSYDSFSFHQQLDFFVIEKPKMEIVKVTELKHQALITYLEKKRGISLATANLYCKEVHYLNKGRPFFSVGFRNNSGGYELRNASFKSCFSPKTYTHYNYGNESIAVFEGFVDFLSALELKITKGEKNDFLILNSLANKKKVFEILDNYREINLYLNNDEAGEKAADEFKKLYPKKLKNMNKMYKEYNDLNDFLIMKKKEFL